MRVLSQTELARPTKRELHILLHNIASELPHLPEYSPELHAAHFNLQNIRRVIAALVFQPGNRANRASRIARRIGSILSPVDICPAGLAGFTYPSHTTQFPLVAV